VYRQQATGNRQQAGTHSPWNQEEGTHQPKDGGRGQEKKVEVSE